MFGFYPVSKLIDMSRFNDITDMLSVMTIEKIDLTAENVVACSGNNIRSNYENRFNFIPDIPFTAVVCEAPPVKPTPVGADQVYSVPAGTIPFSPLVGVIEKPIPLQVIPVMVLIYAVGLMVTVTVNGAPMQGPEVGVTI